MFDRRRQRRRRERIDPFGVGEPWRRFVQEALQAEARYRQAVSGVAAGPLRERLDDIGRRIEQATHECWRIARRGDALQEAVSALDECGAKVRLEAMVTDAREQLVRLEVGLARAVNSAVELSARSAHASDTAGVSHDLQRMEDEIATLRSAMDELSGPEA